MNLNVSTIEERSGLTLLPYEEAKGVSGIEAFLEKENCVFLRSIADISNSYILYVSGEFENNRPVVIPDLGAKQLLILVESFVNIRLVDGCIEKGAQGNLEKIMILVGEKADVSFISCGLRGLDGGEAGVTYTKEVSVYLAEEGAKVRLYALPVLAGGGKVKLDLTCFHQAPGTKSHIESRAVLSGEAGLVVNGKTVIEAEAIGSSANQQLHAMLLSADSKIEQTPILDIKNNDVLCEHGASVSRPNEETLFYYQSRGIEKKAAVALALQSHIAPVLEAVGDEDLVVEIEAFIRTIIE